MTADPHLGADQTYQSQKHKFEVKQLSQEYQKLQPRPKNFANMADRQRNKPRLRLGKQGVWSKKYVFWYFLRQVLLNILKK